MNNFISINGHAYAVSLAELIARHGQYSRCCCAGQWYEWSTTDEKFFAVS